MLRRMCKVTACPAPHQQATAAAYTHGCLQPAAPVDSLYFCCLSDVERSAAGDNPTPFQDQAVQKGEIGTTVVLSSVSEPLQPLSPKFTDGPEGLEACVSQHLATDALTLEWQVI